MVGRIKNQVVLLVIVVEAICIGRIIGRPILQDRRPGRLLFVVVIPILEDIGLVFKNGSPRCRVINEGEARDMRLAVIPIHAERIVRPARLQKAQPLDAAVPS